MIINFITIILIIVLILLSIAIINLLILRKNMKKMSKEEIDIALKNNDEFMKKMRNTKFKDLKNL
ncbi:MAG: hypothetical protein K0Q49_2117 [Haloplasmataceae bacterium]|jgi:cbb3-type cytochrome oxidase subunit 3|nr:hypothetical protein [Haloplasmataceae bacterium]